MSRLSVNCCAEAAIISRCYQNVQKGHGSIWSGIFTCELNVMVNGVYMVQKVLFVSCFNDYKGVIYKSLPHQRGCGYVFMALISKSSIYRFATIGLIGEPKAAPSTCL